MRRMRRRYASEEERQAVIAQAVKLHQDGRPQMFIANELGVSQATINKWVRKHGPARQRALQARLATKIRRELVCCDIYERMRVLVAGGDEYRALREGPSYHDICFYGELAARMCEEPLP